MIKIVIVGHGMAGARLVQELRHRDPERQLHITVFGAERGGAYNRVLLSNVLAGRASAADIAMASPQWYADNGVDLRTGKSVVAIDRDSNQVVDRDGQRTGYDVLVLATGSRPFVPPVKGMTDPTSGARSLGVEVFRTLEDCEAIVAAAGRARRAVVLGGGLLGLEAARGLAGRGLDVEVVHAASHLMNRQLDPEASDVLIASLADLGVSTRVETKLTEVTTSGSPARVTGLVFADGTQVEADLLIVSCGVTPDVDLARTAGLRIGRGITVDNNLRSVGTDNVYAIGECAEHDGQLYGLVAPAWEQARVLADVLTGADPNAHYCGSRSVTRLKAAGIDLAAMGETTQTRHDDEVLRFHDPRRGTYKKVVIRDERLVGAILLGDGATAGVLTQLFDRQSNVPQDRLALLFERFGAAAETATPARMPSAATVCQCNGVTKRALTDAYLSGCRTVSACADRTRATTGCGSCKDTVAGILSWLKTVEPDQEPALSPTSGGSS